LPDSILSENALCKRNNRLASQLYSIGVDFGATKISAALVAAGGERIATAKADTGRKRIVWDVVADLIAVVRCVAQQGEVGLESVAGIGIGAAGQIAPQTGTIVLSPNLQWRDVPLGAMLREAFQRPVVVLNDVNAAALGEFHSGAGKGFGSLVAVFVGSGIGGGIIIDGTLWQGSNGAAAEIGHMIYRPGGELCGCGQQGCFEAYAGGVNVERRFREAVGGGTGSLALELAGGDADKIYIHTIAEAARRGDAFARSVFEDFKQALGILAANLISVLNPDVLVLGGGIPERIPSLIESVSDSIQAHATVLSRRAVEVCMARCGEDAALLGAAFAAFEGAKP
jgi:glucokinase